MRRCHISDGVAGEANQRLRSRGDSGYHRSGVGNFVPQLVLGSRFLGNVRGVVLPFWPKALGAIMSGGMAGHKFSSLQDRLGFGSLPQAMPLLGNCHGCVAHSAGSGRPGHEKRIGFIAVRQLFFPLRLQDAKR